MLPTIFIAIWILTCIALIIFAIRVVIRIQTKKLGMDDLFLGIGALILFETYMVGTVLYGWVEEMYNAVAQDDYVWLLENCPRIIRYWYSTSATYIFSIWSIKMGIAWFLCRLSNNILQYGRWKNILFYYIVCSFVCVVVIFWSTCPPDDFVTETLASSPPVYTRCKWQVQVLTPTVFNVIADIILFLYPFPIIFLANIPKSLRSSLLFLFGLCGLVTASAIIRVTLMTAGKLLQEGNLYALTWWAAIEASVSLLVASLPVIGGKMISHWKHILTRSTTHRSAVNLSRSFRSRHSVNVAFSQNEVDTITLAEGGAYIGTDSDKGVETFVSSGNSTLTEKPEREDDGGLISQVARMGRRASTKDVSEDPDPQHFTVTKEIYIKEEQVKFEGSPNDTLNDSPV